jgi:glycosyltransferase involved in cell wall biosynthesis
MPAVKFSCFSEAERRSGGNRFWNLLCAELRLRDGFSEQDYRYIFLNISAPFGRFWSEWVNRRKIIVRLDGIYHERICPAAIATVRNPLARGIFTMLLGIFGSSPVLSFLLNLYLHNLKLVIKVALADSIIFQSRFSQSMWKPYFPLKRSAVILNGDQWRGETTAQPGAGALLMVTTYDRFRPAKRLSELVRFVRWCNEDRGFSCRLTILGFEHGRRPANFTPDDAALVENSGYFRLVPPFKNTDQEFLRELAQHHVYTTFTFRDNCPNAVIEAMSTGLPVVALDSGGVGQLVSEAGEIIPVEKQEAYFSSFDCSYDYPEFDRESFLKALQRVGAGQDSYRGRVQARFARELELHRVCELYLEALNGFSQPVKKK